MNLFAFGSMLSLQIENLIKIRHTQSPPQASVAIAVNQPGNKTDFHGRIRHHHHRCHNHINNLRLPAIALQAKAFCNWQHRVENVVKRRVVFS